MKEERRKMSAKKEASNKRMIEVEMMPLYNEHLSI
jgi:hypothetical protein